MFNITRFICRNHCRLFPYNNIYANTFSSGGSKVPDRPHQHDLIDDDDGDVELDEATLHQLQRWSLVKLDDDKALSALKKSIKFANKILKIDTEGVEPLYTVLENKYVTIFIF